MNFEYDLQTAGPRDPTTNPDEPDTPHLSTPEPSHEPPDPHPVTDPIPEPDPGTEPFRQPEPIPSFPEPIPGGPPDVVI